MTASQHSEPGAEGTARGLAETSLWALHITWPLADWLIRKFLPVAWTSEPAFVMLVDGAPFAWTMPEAS